MPEGGGPIYEVAGISKVPVEGWVLHMDEHSFLDGPGMAVYLLCTILNCSGSIGCPVVVL